MLTVFDVFRCVLEVFSRSIQYTVATGSTGSVACGSSILKDAQPQPMVWSKSVWSSPVPVFFPVHATGLLNTSLEPRVCFSIHNTDLFQVIEKAMTAALAAAEA
jgi:hypothetical protein